MPGNVKEAKVPVAECNPELVTEPGDMPQDRNTATIREKRPNEGKAWSVEEERRLHGAFWALTNVRDLSVRHGRTSVAIRSRLKKMGLLDESGIVVKPKPAFSPSTTKLPKVPLPNQYTYSEVTQHCDDAQLLDLFYHLSMKQRASALSYIRWLVASLDRN